MVFTAPAMTHKWDSGNDSLFLLLPIILPCFSGNRVSLVRVARVILKCILIFSEDRIRSGMKKLTKARQGSTQGRLDSFFKVLPSPSPSNKRKVRKLIL